MRATQSKCKTLRIVAVLAVAQFALCFLGTFAPAATRAEALQAPAAKSITVNGVVHNAGGEPIPAADIYLDDEKNTAQAHTVSDEDGSFKLTVDHGGTYTVRAAKGGWTGDQSDPIELPRDANKRIELVMENSRNQSENSESNTSAAKGKTATALNSSTAKGGSNGIEFSDEPNFTVAGVTDRSNLGLHGSDTTARTSDDLARETARLKGEMPRKWRKPPPEQPKISERDRRLNRKVIFLGAREFSPRRLWRTATTPKAITAR